MSQSVTDGLLSRIRSGALTPGDKLPTVNALMEELGVGRNTIREAMQALVVMGLVEVRPRVGATVKAASGASAASTMALSALLDANGVRDLYDFRGAVEVAAAAFAAERATPADVEEIDSIVNRYIYDVEHDLQTYEDDLALHQAIARASHNEFFIKVLGDVADLLEAVRRETDKVPGASERAAQEHLAIATAIRQNDPAAARKAMEDHIRSAVWAVDRALSAGQLSR